MHLLLNNLDINGCDILDGPENFDELRFGGREVT